MKSETEKTKGSPLNIVAFALLMGGTSFGALYAMSNLQTDENLTFAAVVKEIPYDMEPDGTAVYRFGRNGRYNITCKGETPVTWDLAADRSTEEVDHICAKISQQRGKDS